MRTVIDYRPERDVYNFYLSAGKHALDSDGSWVKLEQGDEIPVFMTLSLEQYSAIRNAILERESPRLAESALLKEMLEDTRTVRDRMISLVELTP